MEHITDAIVSAEAELKTKRELLAEHREIIAMLEQEAKRIEIELVGLRSYAQRRGLTPNETSGLVADDTVVPISASVALAAEPAIDLSLLSRNEAVAQVLGKAPAPMDRTAISEHLADHGRFEGLDDISLSLSGLKRAGRVEKLGRGLWRLADHSSATGS